LCGNSQQEKSQHIGYNTSDFNGIQVNVYAPIRIVVMRSEDIAIFITGQYLACSDCSSIVKSKVVRTAGRVRK